MSSVRQHVFVCAPAIGHEVQRQAPSQPRTSWFPLLLPAFSVERQLAPTRRPFKMKGFRFDRALLRVLSPTIGGEPGSPFAVVVGTGAWNPRMMMRTASSVEERDSEQKHSPPQRTSRPRPGDVLVSRPTARADVYAISVVPRAAHMTARRYPEAIDTAEELARQLRVDGWFTCNHTHYAPVARHRS